MNGHFQVQRWKSPLQKHGDERIIYFISFFRTYLSVVPAVCWVPSVVVQNVLESVTKDMTASKCIFYS